MVFVNSPHCSNEDHVELDFPVVSLSTTCCAFAFLKLRIKPCLCRYII